MSLSQDMRRFTVKIKLRCIPNYGNLYEELEVEIKNSLFCTKTIYDSPDRYHNYCYKVKIYFVLGKAVFSTKEKYYDF